MLSDKKKKIASIALAGILSVGGFASAAFAADDAKAANTDKPTADKANCKTADGKEKHACKGKNSCKGNGADGKNDCKGKGSCATDGSKPMDTTAAPATATATPPAKAPSTAPAATDATKK